MPSFGSLLGLAGQGYVGYKQGQQVSDERDRQAALQAYLRQRQEQQDQQRQQFQQAQLGNIVEDNKRQREAQQFQRQQAHQRLTQEQADRADRAGQREQSRVDREQDMAARDRAYELQRKNIESLINDRKGGGGDPDAARAKWVTDKVAELSQRRFNSLFNEWVPGLPIEEATAQANALWNAGHGAVGAPQAAPAPAPSPSGFMGRVGAQSPLQGAGAPIPANVPDPHAQQRADWDAAATVVRGRGQSPEAVLGARP